ncbi:MAG: M28 family peptidase, partial [Kofleriaceae bacterium]
VVGALQLDMTNYQGSDRDIWIIDDYTCKEQNKFLIDLIETYTDATWGSDKCGYACSDHASWHRAGVPASMPFESRSKEMNKRIHTKNDTLEQSKDNALHAVKFARLGAAYAIELAKGRLVERRAHRHCGTMAADTHREIREMECRARGGCDDDSTPVWMWFGLALTAAGTLWLSRRAG